jgi:hypothetical protein
LEALVVLSVALEEGFEDDAVVVEVNGRKVFEQDGVSTRTQIGLAVSFEVPIDQPDAVTEVRLPARGAAGQTRCTVVDRLYVGVSVQSGDVVFRTSEEPFGYV